MGWKNLVKNNYPSLTALENACVQLIEQIFWSLGSDPAYEIVEKKVEHVSEPEVLEEDMLDWLEDGVDTSPTKSPSKKNKKKEKKKKAEEDAVFESTEGEECVDDDVRSVRPKFRAALTCGS